MFVSESMYELGSKRSAIRELFEYGKKRAAIVGAENVYDFSLGNPTVPAPDCVNETIRELTQSLDSISLHGVLGCIAGDDTIMCVVKETSMVDEVMKEIDTIMKGHR